MAVKVEELANGAPKSAIRDPVIEAILERIKRQPPHDAAQIEKALREIGERCSNLPVLDNHAPDEILGYGDDGLPH